MKIYILKISDDGTDLLPFLSEQRMKVIENITNKKVRAEKICSYALLRYAIFMEYGIDELFVFNYGKVEKPYLRDYPRIFFNMSHAGGYCACGVSDEEIGVDLQDYRPMREDITCKICTKKEIDEIYCSCSPTPSETTCRMWCMKESYGKLTGKGFTEGFDTIETGELREKGVLKSADLTLDDELFFVSVSAYSRIDDIEIEILTEKDIRYILS